MKKHLFYLSILTLLLAGVQLQSCKKDKNADPEIQTTSVTALSLTNVLMKGNILSKGSFKVQDYGFVYSTTTSGINETIGTKVSLGQNPPEGEYSKEVDGIAVANGYSPVLYVRAYLTNERGTAFGKLTTITLPTPSTSNVTPLSGKSGDQVTITGQFYTTSASDVTVTFGGVRATVVSVSQTQIVVQVPSGIPASHNSQISIVVSVAGRNTTASYGFTIQANIKDYSPKSGPIGTLVTFTGDNLPSYYYSSDISVSFGGVLQNLGYYSNMQVAVPSTVTSNSFQISVTEGGKTYALPGTFSVTAPTISSISPTSALAGSSVTVYGSNFPAGSGVTATLGGVNVNIYSYNSGQFTFTVPSNMAPGSYAFIMKAGSNTVSAPQNFTVTSPSVSGFSPSSGAIGRQVTINGTFVSGQNYTVYFGSVQASGYATSSSSLSTNVPYGISGGDYKISMSVGGQTITAPGTFTVTTPSITSFSPTSGVPGDVITINGTGFNSSSYYGASVSFGTVIANVLSITDNTIKVTVPTGAGSGAMKITVTTSGQTVVSTDNFTVVH